jgi:polysaccharide export outer membrane protein
MNFRNYVLFMLMTTVFAGCGGSSTRPPSATTGGGDTSGSETSVEFDASNYQIGPGDMLDIFVWRNPEISATVPVRPDGKISTPLVEDMVAVGKTPSELARDMEQVLATYIKAPSVNVIVKEFQGTYAEQVRVVGQAANPQAIPFREGMTVLDLVIAVGGLGEFAAGNRAKLLRVIDGETVEYKIRLDDLLNKGRIEHNIAIKPGDVLIIPESFF